MQAAREGRAAARRCSGVLLAMAVVMGHGADAVGAQEHPGGPDAFTLEGLVVTAAPTTLAEDAVSSHVTIIEGDELRRRGGGSLADALREVSGVQVVRGGSFGAVTSLFLRGGESDYTLVLIDGVQVNQAGGGFDFAELGTDAVERVEIVRGPASALYGSDAVTGVIHVITRSGLGAPEVTLDFEVGSFGRRDVVADLRAGSDRASYGFSYARRTMDGIFALNNESVRTVLTGVGRFQPDDRTRLEVNVRLSDREYHFPTNSAGAVVDENAFTFSDGTTARLAASRSVTSRITVEATLGINEFDGGTDDARDGPADTLGFYGFTSLDHFRRSAGELRGHLTFDDAVLTVGVEYEEERQRSFTESLSEFGPSSGRSASERDNVGYFLHLTGDAGGFSYQVGGRTEDNERFGVSATWQAGVATALPASIGGTLRGSIGTAIKEPTFFETFATGFARGNPDLDPERSFSWEVGVERSIAGVVTAGVTYFDQTFQDLIQYTFAPPNPGDPNYFNVAAAQARGLEMEVDAARGRWSGGVSAGWVETRVTDSGFDDGPGASFVEGEALLRRPTWKGTVRGAADLGRVDVSARLSHTGEREDRDFSTFPANPVTLASYQLFSVDVAIRAVEPAPGRPGFTLRVSGENLLDTEYEELFGFPTPGRALYVSGRLTLGG